MGSDQPLDSQDSILCNAILVNMQKFDFCKQFCNPESLTNVMYVNDKLFQLWAKFSIYFEAEILDFAYVVYKAFKSIVISLLV